MARIEMQQEAADIGGLVAIEIAIAVRLVAVAAGAVAPQEAERHQRVEEVAGAASMDTGASG